MGGLAIRNLVGMAPRVHRASLAATCHLTASLVEAAAWFDLGVHRTCGVEAGLVAQRDQLQDEGIFLKCQGRSKSSMAR
jgi:hypothetical protein